MTSNRNAQALPLALEQPATHSARLLDENELAFRQRRSVKTLRNDRWRRSGVPFLKLGRSVRYRIEDVLRYEQQQLRATSLGDAS
jgi:hypothetical protein